MGLLAAIAVDLRVAVRNAARTPAVSGAAVVSLALGIGAVVAMFSLVNALVLKALPVHAPERLVRLALDSASGRQVSFSNPVWEYLRDRQEVFEAVAATAFARFNLNTAGEMRMVPGLYVDGRFLSMLGVAPVLGRAFTPADDARGGGGDGPVAMLSYGFWQREYGGDPHVVGRTLSLDDHAFTIVGVTPPSFFGVRVGLTFDVVVPLAAEAVVHGPESWLDRRASSNVTIIGRLAPGQPTSDAQAQLRALQPALREATRPAEPRPDAAARYLRDPLVLEPAATGFSFLRDRYRRPLLVLLAIAGVVLSIACLNMANLLLAQAVARRRDLSVQLSLGATRLRLARQLLLESVLLALASAALGVLAARWGSRMLVLMLSTRTSPVELDLSMDARVAAFTTGVGLLVGLLSGVLPAVRGTAQAPAEVLKDHARGIVAGGRMTVGHALVAAQVALSFVLVWGATLFVRTEVELTTQPLGFESARVLVGSIDLRRTAVAAERRFAWFMQARDAVAAAPGIDSAALAFLTPVSGSNWNIRVEVPGGPEGGGDRPVFFNGVSSGYFRAMGTPLIAGRDIAPSDVATSAPVAVVNRAFADKYLPGRPAIGQAFAIEGTGRRLEVVGLVADAKYRTLRESPEPTVYAPMAQEPRPPPSSVRIVVRASGPAPAFRQTVIDAIGRVDSRMAVDVKAFDEDLQAGAMQERLVAALSAVFGTLALLLAGLGLYGVMSYAVARRRAEVGVRMALGASPAVVGRMIFGQVAAVTAAGLVLGALGAAAAGRLIGGLLYGLAPGDPATAVAGAVALATASALAAWLPARRASRIDAAVALRED